MMRRFTRVRRPHTIVTAALAGLCAALLGACLVLPMMPAADTPVTGDPARGGALFVNLGGDTPACATCHSVAPSPLPRFGATNGPSLVGIGERAGARVPGLSAEAYLRESILTPDRYLVEGYDNLMYADYAQVLSAQALADLIAYLLSL